METTSIATFGERQRQLLTLLLETKDGMSVDDLTRELDISRSAVHQHLVALERDGYLEKQSGKPRGGRPGYTWCLTDRGIHLFPKQYALFSDLLIQSLREELGSGGLVQIMQKLGNDLAEDHLPRLRDMPDEQQIEAVADIMTALGYQARTAPDPKATLPLIDARNCIYHHLAQEHREVCELDLALLSTLLNTEIEHIECMVRGGKACRFRALKRDKD